MNKLRAYLNSLTPAQQIDVALRCGTTIGYLRKAISIKQALSESLAIAIERETGGQVTVADLRPEFAASLQAAGYVRIQSKPEEAA